VAIGLIYNTYTFTTTGSVDTTGATLLVCVVCGSSTSNFATPPSDSFSNTWTKLSTYGDNADTNLIAIYYVFNPTVGPGHTFTSNTGGGGTSMFSVWSGTLQTSAVFDTQNGFGQTVGGNSTIQPGSITPAGIGELLITGLNTPQGTAYVISVDSGFTIMDTQQSFTPFCAHAYLIDSSASPINPTWTITSVSTLGSAIAAFKPPAAPAAGVFTQPSVAGSRGMRRFRSVR